MTELPPVPDVAGIALDGSGFYTISSVENAELCRSTGVEPAADGNAHPIYYFIATQLGMGKSVAELCAAFDFDVADGPMIIGSAVEFRDRLRVGVPYGVRGEILSVVRKQSQKLGVMDIGDYRLRLLDGEHVVAELTNSWVFPRRGQA